MSDQIDAVVAARKIMSAINELLDGAQAHLEELEEQGRLTDESEDEDDRPSDIEIESARKIIETLEDVVDKFQSIILPELRQ